MPDRGRPGATVAAAEIGVGRFGQVVQRLVAGRGALAALLVGVKRYCERILRDRANEPGSLRRVGRTRLGDDWPVPCRRWIPSSTVRGISRLVVERQRIVLVGGLGRREHPMAGDGHGDWLSAPADGGS